MEEQVMLLEVKRTERGWAGHFVCASRCLFRRNTLLECGDVRLVISTVGMMKGYVRFEQIGLDRHYETMAFHAERYQERYWDADVQREVQFVSPWAIAEVDADDRANDMHEVVVTELTERLSKGERFDAGEKAEEHG